MPVCGSDICPLRRVEGVDQAQIERWWSARALLSERVRAAQSAGWRLRNEAQMGTGLLAATEALQALQTQAGVVLVLWKELFAKFVALGSARVAVGELAFHWQTLANHSVYEIGSKTAAGATATAAAHVEPSLVFELVCSALVLICCRQQLATIVMLDDEFSPADALAILGVAKIEAELLRSDMLPLHFANENGTESWLLAPYFYSALVCGLISAQSACAQARQHRNSGELFEAAACMEVAAIQTKYAARSGFAGQCDLGALAAHRHGVALLMLAVALDNESRLGDGGDESRMQAIEAVVCARAAADLLPDSGAIAAVCQETLARMWERAKTLFGFFVAHEQLEQTKGARHSVRLEVADYEEAQAAEAVAADGAQQPGGTGGAMRLHTNITPASKVIDLNAGYHFKLFSPL